MKNTLKLFVWEDVLTDYTDGVMFALAESKEEAIALILNKAKECPRIMRLNHLPWMEEELETREPQVYETPVGFFLFGAFCLAEVRMSDFRIAPLHPTPAMIEEGAKRLLRWQDDSAWPGSWEPMQIFCAKYDAERVWRSMWLAAQPEEKRE